MIQKEENITPIIPETINFVIKNCPRTIDGICTYNFPAKVITILSNKYENNPLTYIQSEQMTENGIVICGTIKDIPSIFYINEKIQDKELFDNLSIIFELTFSFSNYYFISKKSYLCKDNLIQSFLKYKNTDLEQFIGFQYSDYIENRNIIFCDEKINNTPFIFIKKDIIAQYKLKNIDLSKITKHIGIHIPEPLIEIIS